MNNKQLTTIYLVRHGESESNAGITTVHSGEGGSHLTEKGKRQAEELGSNLQSVHFDAIYSSDLTRAIQTAEIVKLERDLTVKAIATIRERSIQSYMKHHLNKTRSELENELIKGIENLDDKAKMQYKHTPEMESAEEAVYRLITFLREIAIAFTGKTVLVTNHGNMIRSLLTHLGWATFDELPSGSIANTGYVVLESDGTDFFIKEIHGIEKKHNEKRSW